MAPLARDAERWAEQRLGSGGPEDDHDVRLYELKLELQPHPARRDLSAVRAFVQTSFAICAPFEVLHRVRDEHAPAVDARLRESLVENAASRADERMPGEIFLVAGLLTYEDGGRRAWPLAEDGLRRPGV